VYRKFQNSITANFFFQNTTRNLKIRPAVIPVAQVIRLDELVHDATFGDVEPEKIALVEFGGGDELVFLEGQAVNGEIFTQRTPIDPAVGKNKIIVGHQAGAFKFFIRVRMWKKTLAESLEKATVWGRVIFL
jgi:hypothetical protein